PDHRRGGEWGGGAGPAHRQRRPQAPDRLRAELRLGHRARRGRHRGLFPLQDVVVMTAAHPGFPYLTVLVLLPAAGAAIVALSARAPRRFIEAIGLISSVATLGFAIT